MKRTTDRKPARRGASLSPAGSRVVAAFDEAIEAVRSEGKAAATSKLTMKTYAADFALRNTDRPTSAVSGTSWR